MRTPPPFNRMDFEPYHQVASQLRQETCERAARRDVFFVIMTIHTHFIPIWKYHSEGVEEYDASMLELPSARDLIVSLLLFSLAVLLHGWAKTSSRFHKPAKYPPPEKCSMDDLEKFAPSVVSTHR